jgi:hypothetical protein
VLTSDQEAVEYARRLIVGTNPVVRDGGYVPDQSTAIRIATAVLIPIYGEKIEDGEKPWRAGLKGDVWTVVGTFHGKGSGGEAIVQLSKTSGAVLFVIRCRRVAHVRLTINNWNDSGRC